MSTTTGTTRLRLSCIIPLLLTFVAAAPISLLFISGSQLFVHAPEFVSHRIGDALNIMTGEAQVVRPVQGLSNGLLSKEIILALYGIYGREIVSPPILQAYSAGFFIIVFGVIATVVTSGWALLTPIQRTGLGLLALAPFYLGGPAIGLMIAPDYWIGEYAYLLCCLVALGFVASLKQGLRSVDYALGAFIGIGIALKITMLPIAAVVAASHPFGDTRSWCRMAVGAAAMYVFISLIYFDFSLRNVAGLLYHQLLFFIRPNESIQYGSFAAVADARPLAVVAGIAATLCAVCFASRNPFVAAIALMWIAAYVLVIIRRPHDSSLTSACLAFFFLIAVTATRPTLAIAIAMMVGGAIYSDFSTLRTIRSMAQTGQNEPAPPEITNADIVFVPTTDWVARIPILRLGHSGFLGVRPLQIDQAGRLAYQQGGNAFQLFFPGQIMASIMSPDIDQLLGRALKNGETLGWTRSDVTTGTNDHAILLRLCNSSDIVCIERRMVIHGESWLVGVAAHRPRI